MTRLSRRIDFRLVFTIRLLAGFRLSARRIQASARRIQAFRSPNSPVHDLQFPVLQYRGDLGLRSPVAAPHRALHLHTFFG